MKTSLNVLPYTLRRRQLVRVRLLQWCLIWGTVTAAAGGVLYMAKYVPYQARLAELQARERKYAPLNKLKTELDAMRAELDDLQKREALAMSLADDVPDLTLLGVISRAARQSDGKVYIERLSLGRETTPQSTAPDEPGASAGRKRGGVLKLNGAGLDNLSVARFVAALRDCEVFDKVELKSTGIQTAAGAGARSYLVECVF
jgi:Tfp pilus assembly protein PilN